MNFTTALSLRDACMRRGRVREELVGLLGHVKELPLADLVQAHVGNRRTGVVRLTGPDVHGELYLDYGRVVHARFGDLVGPPAVYAMLGEPELHFEVEVGAVAPLRTVDTPWPALLLEAARQADEGCTPSVRRMRFTQDTGELPVASEVAEGRRASRRVTGIGAARKPPPNRLRWAAVAVAVIGGLAGVVSYASRTQEARSHFVGDAIDASALTGPEDLRPVLLSGELPEVPSTGLAVVPTIVCRLHIDERGVVTHARIYRSRLELAAFEEAALEAVRSFRFAPAQKGGEAVPVWLNWPVTFRVASSTPQVTLRIKGSDTIGGALGPALGKAYERASGDVRVAVEALGSGTGFVGLFDGTADLGASSRPIKEKELREARSLGLELREFVIGYDGIAVVVHPNNPVKSLTVEEVSRVFSGSVRDWRELGGPPGPIHRVSRPSYSGTHDFFADKVLRRGDPRGTEQFASDTVYVERNEAVIARVAQDKTAISYVGLGWVEEAVKVMPLARSSDQPPVLPSPASIHDGTYPVYRSLLMYTRKPTTPDVVDFLRFVLSREGQAIVAHHGFAAGLADTTPLMEPGLAQEVRRGLVREVSRISFRFASVNLSTDARKRLQRVAERLQENPGARVMLMGHTDGEGPQNNNIRLSGLRAERVASYLRKAGVADERIAFEAASSDKPIATNTTDAGRRANRRVDVYLVGSGRGERRGMHSRGR